jgi:hypothetical protein
MCNDACLIKPPPDGAIRKIEEYNKNIVKP